MPNRHHRHLPLLLRHLVWRCPGHQQVHAQARSHLPLRVLLVVRPLVASATVATAAAVAVEVHQHLLVVPPK